MVRPIIGCPTHSHFWEGPCRTGYKKDIRVITDIEKGCDFLD